MVCARAVNVKLLFYHVRAFTQHRDEILGGAVAVLNIIAVTITTQWVDRFQAGGTAVVHLNKVKVTLGGERDAYPYLVAYAKCTAMGGDNLAMYL